MAQEKWIVTSKTIWGLVIMALPLVAKLAGWQFTGEDTVAMQQTFDAVITAVGMALGVWGRLSAKAGVRALP